MKRREFLARSLGLPIAGLGLPFAVSAEPSVASATLGHRVLNLELLDANRKRPVPVRLYLPQQASPNGPVPLVVFSHGLGGSRMGYSYLARHWADAGMASLHPQRAWPCSRHTSDPRLLFSRCRSVDPDPRRGSDLGQSAGPVPSPVLRHHVRLTAGVVPAPVGCHAKPCCHCLRVADAGWPYRDPPSDEQGSCIPCVNHRGRARTRPVAQE